MGMQQWFSSIIFPLIRLHIAWQVALDRSLDPMNTATISMSEEGEDVKDLCEDHECSQVKSEPHLSAYKEAISLIASETTHRWIIHQI